MKLRPWRRKKKREQEVLLPVPAQLPPLEGADEPDEAERRQQRLVSRWTAGLAAAAVLVTLFVLTASGLGIYNGLRARREANRVTAREHYALGLQHLEEGAYELAVGELELARRYDPTLPDVDAYLREAQALAQGGASPTSEARRGAIDLLYRQGVKSYEEGGLEEAIAAFEELRGLDREYQRKNVETMLVNAHYELGLTGVRQDLLDDASAHFQAVLALGVDPARQEMAQDQLNLLDLYRAALSRWGQDWPATIQALKGLYALAPEYKDVRARLHDAHVLYAQTYAGKAEWCKAQEEYDAAVQVFPLEETVDRRDDAAIQCQVALAVTVAPTAKASPTRKPTPVAGSTPAATPTAGTQPVAAVGRIVYPVYDGILKRQSLYIVDVRQPVPQLLVGDASQPAFAPDHQQLAYRNLESSHQELGILNLRTNTSHSLTHNVEDSAPTWSPGADQIVYASNREGDRRWRMYVISPLANREEGNFWGFGQMPAWAPDGSEIAYRGCDLYGNNCALWVMEPGNYNQARLTTDPSDSSPSWKPDSSQVAFVSSRAGNWEIYAIDAASGVERRLTNHPATDVAPAWSPDGKSLAFLSNRDGAWSVYILDIKSGQVQRLVDAGDAYPDPVQERLTWAP